ncbi:MAG: ROK family protein [Bacteroidetes bacterium]|nr:ROK family protein [Bacteroidota bacterium]
MNEKVIGIDLGATNIRGAIVQDENLSEIFTQRIQSKGSEEDVLNDIFTVTDRLMRLDVQAIGIGVPSVVDVEEGIVYDVQYIPSWKEVHLKKYLEDRYHIPVFINNDANCFALGEYYFGKGKGRNSMIGLTVGTGVGAGIIINKKLYAGRNCGAGEFGTVDYLDKIYEYYCSGSFFENVYGLKGEFVFEKAQQGDAQMLKLYEELGTHLGNCIKMILYTFDPELIVLGGSVRLAFDFFAAAMWKQIRTCVYTKFADRLAVEVSSLKNSGILGAAALYFDAMK